MYRVVGVVGASAAAGGVLNAGHKFCAHRAVTGNSAHTGSPGNTEELRGGGGKKKDGKRERMRCSCA